MGCDIHWTIERRHRDGTWHSVDSQSHFYDRAGSEGFAPWSRPGTTHEQREAFYKLTGSLLGSRNYTLFGALSNVRGECVSQALLEGVPEDASQGYRDEVESWSGDGHSHGWAIGSDIAKWGRKKVLAPYARTLRDHLKSGAANSIMSARCEGHEVNFEEFAGIESGHQAIERQVRSQGLLDWKKHSEAWRLLVFYDN